MSRNEPFIVTVIFDSIHSLFTIIFIVLVVVYCIAITSIRAIVNKVLFCKSRESLEANLTESTYTLESLVKLG